MQRSQHPFVSDSMQGMWHGRPQHSTRVRAASTKVGRRQTTQAVSSNSLPLWVVLQKGQRCGGLQSNGTRERSGLGLPSASPEVGRSVS